MVEALTTGEVGDESSLMRDGEVKGCRSQTGLEKVASKEMVDTEVVCGSVNVGAEVYLGYGQIIKESEKLKETEKEGYLGKIG